MQFPIGNAELVHDKATENGVISRGIQNNNIIIENI